MGDSKSSELQARLDYHLAMEAFVLRVAARFLELGPDDLVDAAIEDTLAEAGTFADVDFTFLVQLDPGGATLSMTHRWVHRDVGALPPLRSQLVAPVREWIDELRTGAVHQIPDVQQADLPTELRRSFEHFGLRSIVVVPMLEQGELVGWIGMATVRSSRDWVELDVRLGTFIGHTFAHTLRRHRDDVALRRSEARFKAFLEQNPDAMYVLELSPPLPIDRPVDEQVDAILTSQVVLCNETAAAFFGMDTSAILGRPFGDAFGGADEATIEALRQDTYRFVNEGYYVRADEIPWTLADGTELWLSRVAHGVVEGKRLTTIWASARNITAAKKARDERELMAKRLQQGERLESIGLLAGGVAHDFNNLLLAILGNAEIAKRHVDPDNRANQSIEEIQRAGRRAAQLTQQLLAFGRRQPTVKKPIDLNSLITATARMLERLLPETIELDLIPGHGLGTILADEAQMEQLFVNLCLNARDAMPHGGRLTIETQNVRINGEYCRTHPWARPGRYMLLTVADTGQGIPEGDLEHVFEPFYTTKGPGKGTGLGLATVYGITKQHGGMIHVYSELEVGTTFKIYLPITEQAAVQVGSEVRPAPPRGHETVLIAEDEPQVRTVAQRILERAGYTVVTVTNGLEAVQAVESQPERFDVVVLDVVMPAMDGRAARERITRIRPDIPILFSSGYTGTVLDGVDLEQLGAPLLPKPYDPDALLAAIRKALDTNR